jgi:hypothetical protein
VIVFALFTLVLAALGEPSPARAQDAGMVDFVRDLYVREIERHNTRSPMSDAAFFAPFTSDLRVLFQAPRHDSEPAGPILDDFFGWGVLPGHPVQLVEVARVKNRGLNLVRVDLVVRGETRQIIVHLARENDLWRIENISYDYGESLRAYLQRITGRP